MNSDNDMSAIILSGSSDDDTAEVIAENKQRVRDLMLMIEYQEWSYSSSSTQVVIPRSYWLSRGFNDEYAERMSTFLGRMRKYSHQLRRGDSIEEIDLWNRHQLSFLHDDILLPYWRELVNALVQYQKFSHRETYGMESFIIWNVELHPSILGLLAPALKTIPMKGLILGYNHFGREGLSFISDILQTNKSLEGIGLRENRIERIEDMQRICKSINISSSHSQLGLLGCINGNDTGMLHTIFDSSLHLEKILLSDNGIDSQGAAVIASSISTNPVLKMLDVGDNNLGDNGTILLSFALEHNTNLEKIYIGNNNITHLGRQALIEVLFNASSLNSCANSNHTCNIFGIEHDISPINRFNDPAVNRAMKIFTMLAGSTDRGEFFNLACLGDLSYKLIPHVLTLAQNFTFGLDNVAVSSVFELLRSWAVSQDV